MPKIMPRTKLVSRRLSAVIMSLVIVVSSGFLAYSWQRAEWARQELQQEMVKCLEEMVLHLRQERSKEVEQAAMRFWRLARIHHGLPNIAAKDQAIVHLADELSDLAVGWHNVPLTSQQREQITQRLLTVTEMVRVMDFSQKDTLLVWLRAR